MNFSTATEQTNAEKAAFLDYLSVTGKLHLNHVKNYNGFKIKQDTGTHRFPLPFHTHTLCSGNNVL